MQKVTSGIRHGESDTSWALYEQQGRILIPGPGIRLDDSLSVIDNIWTIICKETEQGGAARTVIKSYKDRVC